MFVRKSRIQLQSEVLMPRLLSLVTSVEGMTVLYAELESNSFLTLVLTVVQVGQGRV